MVAIAQFSITTGSRLISSPVGGVGVRAEQQRHVVVLVPCGHLEGDRDLGVERRRAAGREVRAGTERGSSRRRSRAGQPEPPVGVRLALTAGATALVAALQPDLNACGGAPGRRVENVRGQCHGLSIFVILRRVIFLARLAPRPVRLPRRCLAGRAAGPASPARKGRWRRSGRHGRNAAHKPRCRRQAPASPRRWPPRAPDCSAADIPPRTERSPMRGCSLMASTISSKLRAQIRYRSRSAARPGPGRDAAQRSPSRKYRRTAGQDVPLGVLRRGSVERAEGHGRLRAQLWHANIQSGPGEGRVAACRPNHR